jgi:hypothetical protein
MIPFFYLTLIFPSILGIQLDKYYIQSGYNYQSFTNNKMLLISAGLGEFAPQYYYEKKLFNISMGLKLDRITSERFNFDFLLYENNSLLYGFLIKKTKPDEEFAGMDITTYIHYKAGLSFLDYRNLELTHRAIDFLTLKGDLFYYLKNYFMELNISESIADIKGMRFIARLAPDISLDMLRLKDIQGKNIQKTNIDYLGIKPNVESSLGLLINNLYSINLFMNYNYFFGGLVFVDLSYGANVYFIIPTKNHNYTFMPFAKFIIFNTSCENNEINYYKFFVGISYFPFHRFRM